MNANQPSQSTLTAYFVAALGALLIVAGLVWAMYRYANPPPIGANRAAERRKNLEDTRAADAALNQYGWVDAGKSIARMPVSQAMQQTIKDYQNPEAAKKELAARVDVASAPPPKPPEPVSKYE
ncbi:MAG: hypothetical protein L0Y58_24610 [Verrucomicrobia subdivision 3 bacterium]|nr:hypothetical protein [Limisphaerales bacterium]